MRIRRSRGLKLGSIGSVLLVAFVALSSVGCQSTSAVSCQKEGWFDRSGDMTALYAVSYAEAFIPDDLGNPTMGVAVAERLDYPEGVCSMLPPRRRWL